MRRKKKPKKKDRAAASDARLVDVARALVGDAPVLTRSVLSVKLPERCRVDLFLATFRRTLTASAEG